MSNLRKTVNPMGAGKKQDLRVTFDRRLKLEFHGSKVTSDAGSGSARSTLTTLREKLIKIGAKVVCHSRQVIFQMAEVAVPRALFRNILLTIGRLRLPVPASG